MTTYARPDLPRRTPAASSDTSGTAVLAVIGFFALLPVLSILGGLVFHYAWDVVILHTFRGAPHTNLAEAIGIGAMVAYYTNAVSSQKSEKGLGTVLLESFFRVGFFLLTIWIVSFFIPGAH